MEPRLLLLEKEEEEEGHSLAKVAGILLVLFSFFTKIIQASVRIDIGIFSSLKILLSSDRRYHSIFEDLILFIMKFKRPLLIAI